MLGRMISRVPPLAGIAALVIAFAGCAGVPTESADSGASPSGAAATAETTAPRSEGSAARSAAATESKRAESSTASAASAKTDPDGPRSSWRAERDSQREARAASSGGSPDNARLLEQLNDASRELATLRAANAKLRAERAAPAAASSSSATTSAARNDPTDDKLAMSLKSYAQFKQEMATVFTDLERLRKENVALSSNLKSAVDQAEQARSAMARLEADLRSEKKSRAEAELAATQLREQLRSIARALSAAGLSVDKLAANAENSGAKSR